MEAKEPKMRVLLVDDDELIRRAAARALVAQLGCEVLTASSGYEAIALMKFGEHVDVAVVDLEMPGMDGVSVIKLMEGLAPELPVGIWTGSLVVPDLPPCTRFVVKKSQPIRDLGYAVYAAGRPQSGVAERRSVIRQIRDTPTPKAGAGR